MESLWLIPTRISIHAPREGSDGAGPGETRPFSISIHAPREGSDGSRDLYSRKNIVISIHAPREGSDEVAVSTDSFLLIFQSTLPARGATK